MKRSTKRIATTIIIIVLVLAIGGPALASQTMKQAMLEYNDIKITLDGAPLVPKDVNGNVVEPFIIDGTTYLPVRAISNSLGMGVDWDPATNTVILTTDSGTQSPPPISGWVWITINGGNYHSTSTCSSMKNPIQATLQSAESMGYTACSKCW